jgi:23S rRNA pseudouridine1911/1915/1917 synthase
VTVPIGPTDLPEPPERPDGDPPEASGPLRLRVPAEAAGERLDVYLGHAVPDQSRASARRLVDGGCVLLDGSGAKASQRLKGGETIEVRIPPVREIPLEPEEIPLDILLEDEALLAVNKPAGMVVHPAPGHERGTLVNALLHHCRTLSAGSAPVRPGIVHRLDRDTSGVLLVAKTEEAHRRLAAQFEARTVGKTYLALTRGRPKPPSGLVEGEMGRHPGNRLLRALLPGSGHYSRSRYATREAFDSGFALVEVALETGRTHQARVHLASVGAPVLADEAYGGGGPVMAADLGGGPAGREEGGPVLARQALHAWRLALDHPLSGGRLTFEAPLPEDMSRALARLREGRAGGHEPVHRLE